MDNIKDLHRGDICWINFEETNYTCEQGGERPALIISNNKNNKYSPTIIVASITSRQKKEYLPVHVPLTTPKERTGLDKKSMVLCEQIKTIDKKRVVKKCGSINIVDCLRVKDALEISLN